MKIDNGAGAEISQHVSPTVAATRFADCGGAHDLLDTDAGVLPAASGEEGAPQMRDTKAVMSDKLEH